MESMLKKFFMLHVIA